MLAQMTRYDQIGVTPSNFPDMVTQIFKGIDALDPRRRYLCVEWLISHCRLMHGENLHCGLTTWLSSLPQDELVHQEKLILMEINWWVAQTDVTVERLMREHFAGRRS